MDNKPQIDPETQFPPVCVYLAKSDAAWLAAWAPDPRALGAHAMGLAALRGLLAEDLPRDGQPLGGEVMHACAVIANARASGGEAMPGEMPVYPGRVRAIERDAEDMATRIVTLENVTDELGRALKSATDNGAAFRKRVGALLGTMYRPEPGDLVDVIDRASDTIIRTARVTHIMCDGVALGHPSGVPEVKPEVVKWGDRYLLPAMESDLEAQP